jgi:hypothetical protein
MYGPVSKRGSHACISYVDLIGMHLIGVDLTGMYLRGVYRHVSYEHASMGVYLMGVHLTGMYLIGTYRRASHWHTSHGRASPTGGTVNNFTNDLGAKLPRTRIRLALNSHSNSLP